MKRGRGLDSFARCVRVACAGESARGEGEGGASSGRSLLGHAVGHGKSMFRHPMKRGVAYFRPANQRRLAARALVARSARCSGMLWDMGNRCFVIR